MLVTYQRCVAHTSTTSSLCCARTNKQIATEPPFIPTRGISRSYCCFVHILVLVLSCYRHTIVAIPGPMPLRLASIALFGSGLAYERPLTPVIVDTRIGAPTIR